MAAEWDIQEVKRLKKKQLVQYNLGMLLFVVLFTYLVLSDVAPSLLFGFCCLFCWVITAYILYAIMTGKTIGTKTSQRVQAFDRDHLGEKRWKRKTLTEALILSVLSIILTVCLFVLDFAFVQLDFPISVFPLIGPWIGFNIGEIVRMNYL